ncbi:26S proteasome non-ATPase regulatory subunit 5 [Nymphon striatum]|nr:26S proteasome non-ATPase regulatory subunit 5 [Nymphon striatum]
MAAVSKLTELFKILPDSSDKLDVLTKISETVCHVCSNDIKEKMESLPIGVIFDCTSLTEKYLYLDYLNIRGLTASVQLKYAQRSKSLAIRDCILALFANAHFSRKELEITVKILHTMLFYLSPDELSGQYLPYVKQSLMHPHPELNEIVLKKLLKHITIEKIIELVTSAELSAQIILKIGDDSSSISKIASDIICEIGKKDDKAAILFCKKNLEKFNDLLKMNETVRFRIYERSLSALNVTGFASANVTVRIELSVSYERLDRKLLVFKVIQTSTKAFEAFDSCDIYSYFAQEINSEDELIQLNFLQLLSDIIAFKKFYQYFNSVGLLYKLENLLKVTGEKGDSRLLYPGLIRFFGAVALLYPKEVFSSYPFFISTVFRLIDLGAESEKSVCIDTLMLISKTPEGKICLHQQGESMVKCLKNLSSIAQGGSNEIRILALECICTLLTLPVSEQTPERLNISNAWFLNLGGEDLLTLIYKYSKLPFQDICTASLNVLKTLAEQSWGQELIRDYAGLLEFLTDPLANAKRKQFEVIKTIVDSPSSKQIFSSEVYGRLKAYVEGHKNGIPSQATVITEDMS